MPLCPRRVHWSEGVRRGSLWGRNEQHNGDILCPEAVDHQALLCEPLVRVWGSGDQVISGRGRYLIPYLHRFQKHLEVGGGCLWGGGGGEHMYLIAATCKIGML